MISTKTRQFIFAGALAASLGIAGCAGGGIAVSEQPGILVADDTGNHFAYLPDMTGVGIQQYGGFPRTNLQSVTFDAQGRCYVVSNDTVVRTQNAAGLNPVILGTRGSGQGQFYKPSSVTVDAQGRIMVCDRTNRRLVRFNNMAGAGWVEKDMEPYMIPGEQPTLSHAIDSQGRIYVVRGHWSVLLRFDSWDDTTPESFGSLGSGVNQFHGPSDVWIDSSDRIYIADSTNHRIVRFDDMTGAGWTTFNSFGANPINPNSICTDSQGRIYVGALGIYRIDDMTGAGLVSYGTTGQFGECLDVLVR